MGAVVVEAMVGSREMPGVVLMPAVVPVCCVVAPVPVCVGRVVVVVVLVVVVTLLSGLVTKFNSGLMQLFLRPAKPVDKPIMIMMLKPPTIPISTCSAVNLTVLPISFSSSSLFFFSLFFIVLLLFLFI